MKTLLRSQELSCPSCVNKIETALRHVEGVQAAKVHFNTGRIEVEYDADVASTDDLLKAIRGAGYEARVAAF